MDETRASAKAIAVGSLIAFFSGYIVITVFMAVGPRIEDWGVLHYPEYVDPIFEDMEPPDPLKIVTMAVMLDVRFPLWLLWYVFALLGGYTAGRMGKEDPALNGKWVGGIVGGILLLFVLLQFLLTLGSGNFLEALLNLVIDSAVATAVFFFAMLGGQSAAARSGG